MSGGSLSRRTSCSIEIDPSRPEPLYQQLREQLRAQIVDGQWVPGSAIPSERSLMSMTKLSRMTVRQAIAELAHEGLLKKDHGRGTFVTMRRADQIIEGVYSFSDGVRAQGRMPGSRVLRRAIVPANDEQAGLLAVNVGDPLIYIERVRLIDSEPAMLDCVHIPEKLCPGLIDADLSGSLYALLRDVFGLPPKRSTDTFEAILATSSLATALECEAGDPLMLMRRLAFTSDDTPLELTNEYARPDRCRYRIRLMGEPPRLEVNDVGFNNV
jgi:GntR family transcriptional regulator